MTNAAIKPILVGAVLTLALPAQAQALKMGRAERAVEKRVYAKYPKKTDGKEVTADCRRASRRKADCTYSVSPRCRRNNSRTCFRSRLREYREGTGTVKRTRSGNLKVQVSRPEVPCCFDPGVVRG
jgi:hypothetical protein